MLLSDAQQIAEEVFEGEAHNFAVGILVSTYASGSCWSRRATIPDGHEDEVMAADEDAVIVDNSDLANLLDGQMGKHSFSELGWFISGDLTVVDHAAYDEYGISAWPDGYFIPA